MQAVEVSLEQWLPNVAQRSSPVQLCLFSSISLLYYVFISFLSPFLFTHPTFHPLVAWLLETLQGPQRQHHPLLPFSTHKGSEKNSYSIFLLFFFFLFPFAPRLFPCCLLWFQNVFSLHEILLILFSFVFSFVGLTFKTNGWKNRHFSRQICTSFISCSHAFHFLPRGKIKKKENASRRRANKSSLDQRFIETHTFHFISSFVRCYNRSTGQVEELQRNKNLKYVARLASKVIRYLFSQSPLWNGLDWWLKISFIHIGVRCHVCLRSLIQNLHLT